MLREAAKTVIRQTARRGGDCARAAAGLLEGLLDRARALGLRVGPSAALLARDLADAAEEFGASAAEEVRAAAAGILGGVRRATGTTSKN
jgi:hypothetical protein